MSAITRDRRAERHAATRREILDAVGQMAREHGFGGLSMRDVGARVGMRAQSLYRYFPSKFAIVDALYAEGFAELRHRMNALARPADPAAYVRARSRTFVAFACEDPVRYQLLFQRAFPGFEPSAQSYAIAVDVLDGSWAALDACGVTDPAAKDLYTAVLAGLAAQQNSNEPGGSRWARLVDEAVDMYLAHVTSPRPKRRP